MSQPALFQIHWRRLSDGRTGIGPAQMTELTAQALANQLNDEHPHIEHLIHPAGADAKPQFQSAPITSDPAAESQPRRFVTLIDSDLMPFGDHKGKRMDQVPADYLSWAEGQPWLYKQWPDVADYIQRHKASIDADLERKARE